MVIPKKVNAAEIIPVNISVKYGQTEGRKIFDMINEMRTEQTASMHGVGMRIMKQKPDMIT